MSADGSSVPESVHIHNYLHLLGVVVLYYDFILTFGQEYSRVWKRPRSLSSILFFLNRYIPVLGDIAVNTGNFYLMIFLGRGVRYSMLPSTLLDDVLAIPVSCRQYAFFRQLLLIVNQVVVCFILFLRTYALYGRDKRIGVLVIGVGGILLGISCWSIVGQHQDIELRGGCHLLAERMTAIRLAVSWEALFAFDCMVFTLTVRKTFRERHRISSGKHDIVSLILRDGALYFAVMASVNFANTLTFYFLEPILRGCLSTFASSVSVTMMSRLMLNLYGSAIGHDVFATTVAYPSTSGNSTTMLFTSRISMPAPTATTALWDDPELDCASGGGGYRRGSAYIRDAQYGDGYVDEVYEMHDAEFHVDGHAERGALRA
ncbi:hypothetical protein C8Q78DRAFT_1076115 [Trametes maxima]|nr:hypothetical protein C8Q78DRAFT_1076115 [Trametes maxima]